MQALRRSRLNTVYQPLGIESGQNEKADIWANMLSLVNSEIGKMAGVSQGAEESCFSLTAFSRSGFIEQLEFDGFI